jgi:hypothetical protein
MGSIRTTTRTLEAKPHPDDQPRCSPFSRPLSVSERPAGSTMRRASSPHPKTSLVGGSLSLFVGSSLPQRVLRGHFRGHFKCPRPLRSSAAGKREARPGARGREPRSSCRHEQRGLSRGRAFGVLEGAKALARRWSPDSRGPGSGRGSHLSRGRLHGTPLTTLFRPRSLDSSMPAASRYRFNRR